MKYSSKHQRVNIKALDPIPTLKTFREIEVSIFSLHRRRIIELAIDRSNIRSKESLRSCSSTLIKRQVSNKMEKLFGAVLDTVLFSRRNLAPSNSDSP